MAKLLIIGDSFAADWTKKYPGAGWPNMLALRHEVTNLSQAGCGQYKIWLQLQSILPHLDQFNFILVSHTSPYRIYVKDHPVHRGDALHGASDLIYNDIIDKVDLDKNLASIVWWFENYFDLDHAKFVHNLICEKIDSTLRPYKERVIHMTNLDWSDLYRFEDMISFESLFKTHRGLMNHYNQEGNELIFKSINQRLKQHAIY